MIAKPDIIWYLFGMFDATIFLSQDGEAFSLAFSNMYTFPYSYNWELTRYSKALRIHGCTDLAGARFWIRSKKIWDERIYEVKTLSSTVFWSSCLHPIISNKSCTNFELHDFFLSPKNVHLKALLYNVYCSVDKS